jgi:hypothetical protein
MSSILEALKKLEDDKARAAEPELLDVDDALAEEELITRARPYRGGGDSRSGGSLLLVGGVVLATLMAAVSAGTSIAALRSGQDGVYAQAPAAPVQAASVVPTVVPAAEPEVVTIVPERLPEPQGTLAEPVQMAYAEPEPLAVVEPEPVIDEPAYVDPAPIRAPAIVESGAASAAPVDDTPKPGVDIPNEPIDLRALPLLTDADRQRHGLPLLQINLLQAVSETRPRGSALINFNTVFVGYTIPQTNPAATLIGVDMRGIAIQVEGQRYYVRRKVRR